MILTEQNLVTWKTDTISAMTVEKYSVIADLELLGYVVTDDTGTNVADWINAITYANIVTSSVIKSQLTTLYSYVSLKYSTIFEVDNIDPIDICPNNSLLSVVPNYVLPTANEVIVALPYISTEILNSSGSGAPVPYSPAHYSVTIVNTPEFGVFETAIPAHATVELDAWNNLATTVQGAIADKVLYQLFRSPKTIQVFKSTKDYLLDDMQLENLIVQNGLNNDFNNLFPQIPLI